ncbi:MAG: CheY-like chemotaxis protein [Polaribacter sp.]|jgi:CheY-like chemotaxis protein
MKMKNILLVDDSEMDNYISEFLVKESNLAEEINVFKSPIEALEYLAVLQSRQEEFPDAIFLDINMPDMDGFGFLDEFSKFPDEIIKATSVFMLTSSDDPNDVKRALNYPVVKKYFVKPLSKAILNEIILDNEFSA